MRDLTALFLLFLSLNLFGQKDTYVSCQIGCLQPRLIVPDNEKVSYPFDLSGGLHAVTFRKELNKTFSVETGLHYYYDWHTGEYLNFFPLHLPGAEHIGVPLYLNIDIPLYRDRLNVFSSVGIQMNKLLSAYSNTASLRTYTSNQQGFISTEVKGYGRSIYPLLGIQGGIRWRVIEKLYLDVQTGFTYGFIELCEYQSEYYLEDQLSDSFTTHTRGEYFNISLKLSYSINRMIYHYKKIREKLQPEDGVIYLFPDS